MIAFVRGTARSPGFPADSPAPFPAGAAQTGRHLTLREKRVGLSEKRVGLFRKRVGLFGKRVGLFFERVRSIPPRVPQKGLPAGKRANTGAFRPPGTRFAAEGAVCALLYYRGRAAGTTSLRRADKWPRDFPRVKNPGRTKCGPEAYNLPSRFSPHVAGDGPRVAGNRSRQAGWHFRAFQLLFLGSSRIIVAGGPACRSGRGWRCGSSRSP